jgi:epoxyqueuosine reductase
MNATSLQADIVAYAQSLGFDRVGITSADPLPDAEQRLGAWVQNGFGGEMTYMAENWRSRARPSERLEGARSVIALAVSYYSGDPEPAAGRGRIARYAWGKDYHKVLEKRLASLCRYIEALAPEAKTRNYVDTGPLLERGLAQRAGLGFIGKNTMLITRKLGSWVFLACVLTTLELAEDSPDQRSCGSCTLCIDACPTEALTEPFQLDARRCISYLTIESRNPMPESLQSQVGDWIFGCDICQEVCPHNSRPAFTPIAEFRPEAGAGPTLNPESVLAIPSDEDFAERFGGTPLKRAKRTGLQRNAKVVLENSTYFHV